MQHGDGRERKGGRTAHQNAHDPEGTRAKVSPGCRLSETGECGRIHLPLESSERRPMRSHGVIDGEEEVVR
jgi:hypothetical protein